MSEFAEPYESRHWTEADYIASMFERAAELGRRLDGMVVPVHEGDLDDDFMADLADINQLNELYPDHTYHFSGTGTAPAYNFEYKPDTAYGAIEGMSGRLTGFVMRDVTKTEYLGSSQLRGEAEEFYDGRPDADIYYDNYRALAAKLQEPPDGLRLYAKFELGAQSGEGLQIAGMAFEAPLVRVFSYVDVSSMRVHTVEAGESRGLRPEDLFTELLAEADEYELLLNREGFRARTAQSQERLLSDRLNQSTAYYNPRSFEGRMTAPLVYSNLFTPDGTSLACYEFGSGSERMTMQLVGIDILERRWMADGMALGPAEPAVSGHGGLCLIGELTEETRASLGLQTPIVWIPLKQPGLEADFGYQSTEGWF